MTFNKYSIDLEVYILNRTDTVLKNINMNFYSMVSEQKTASLRLMDKLKTPYLMPDESVMLYKTLQYDASKEFQLFGEVSYQNNAVG